MTTLSGSFRVSNWESGAGSGEPDRGWTAEHGVGLPGVRERERSTLSSLRQLLGHSSG